jgi:hypothetical protein
VGAVIDSELEKNKRKAWNADESNEATKSSKSLDAFCVEFRRPTRRARLYLGFSTRLVIPAHFILVAFAFAPIARPI